MKKLLCTISVTMLVFAVCLSGCVSDEHVTDEEDLSSADTMTDSQLEELYMESTDSFAAKFSAAILGEADGNACVSPLSLYYALGMLASGVEGDAQAQILDVLNMADASELERACAHAISELAPETDEYKLIIADSLWVSQDYELADAFKETATKDFGAEAFSVKFGTKQADTDMSKWVSDKTNGLLSPNFQTEKEQIASLVNTVYFKDAWVDQFNTEATIPSIFHTDAGDISTPFMNSSLDGCGFADFDDMSMAEMYFTSGSVMTFYLPKPGVSAQSLISTPEAAERLLSAEPDSFPNINYSIPKFSFPTNAGDLVSVLSDMGITDVFSNPSGTAFDSMFEYIGEGEPGLAYVSDVRQETNVSIAEEGVEAAAFTEVGIMEMSAPAPSEPVDFVVDRPFLFKITAPDSTIVFVGMVADPSK